MNFIVFFLMLQNQLRVWHWQTEIFAEHMAFGNTYETLDEHIDRFIEAYTGRYGRQYHNLEFSIHNYPETDRVKKINRFIQVLEEKFDIALQEKDTDLLNIRDEILGDLNKLKYLLTLK